MQSKEPKVECKMSCHLYRIPEFDQSDIRIIQRPRFFANAEWAEQYQVLRPERFPTTRDAEVLAEKDAVLNFLGEKCWIAVCFSDSGALVASAEVMAGFDPNDCRLENVMTHPDFCGHGYAKRVSSAVLRHMIQFGYKWATWSNREQHTMIYVHGIAGHVVETWDSDHSSLAVSA